MTRVRSRWIPWFLAVMLFVVVTALALVVRADDLEGITFLYAVPVTCLAVLGGRRAGAMAAGVAVGLLVMCSAAVGAGASGISVLSRAAALLVIGGITGALADDRSRVGAADTRWFEMSNDMLVEASLDGYFTRLSEEWERCLGWTRQELMARPFRDFIHPDDVLATMPLATALDATPGEVVNFENRYAAKDGSWRWLQWTARSDKHRKYAVARDVTDRRQLEQEREELLGQVQAMARTDALTGLPNRRSWDEELRAAIARAQRDGRALTLAMVDLDNFKLYNDAHGHVAGDELLAEAAARWRLALRATDFLARYGGEEFALLLPDCGPDEAMILVDRFRAATPLDQTCSVGIAAWSRPDGPEDLLARADAALYAAKHDGRDRVVEAERPATFARPGDVPTPARPTSPGWSDTRG